MFVENGHRPVLALGTHDAEMAAVAELCTQAEIPFVYATGPNGRVAYKDAYFAKTVSNPGLVEHIGSLIPVECCIPSYKDLYVGRVDHHRPLDPGYEGDPSDAWLLSSLGQVANHELFRSRIEPHLTPRHYAIGAIDDNPRAVFSNQVPEVSPSTGFVTLIEGIAIEHDLSFETVYRMYKKGLQGFEEFPAVDGWDSEVRDTRVIGAQPGLYNGQDRLLKIAQAYKAKVAVITHCIDEPGGSVKVTVNGADEAGVRNFREWTAELVIAGELSNPYGQERRGYAGAYVNAESAYAEKYGLYLQGARAYNQLVQS